jgi:hypothetical protein
MLSSRKNKKHVFFITFNPSQICRISICGLKLPNWFNKVKGYSRAIGMGEGIIAPRKLEK